MRKYLLFPSIISVLMVSCDSKKDANPSTETVQTTIDSEKFPIDSQKSKIEWKGYKFIKDESSAHFGTIKFNKGEVFVKDGKLQGGNFTADINSIENQDITEITEKVKLQNHLKSADFFDAEKFPVAKFEITGIALKKDMDYDSIIKGNLTIKNTTKSVEFPANIKVENNEISIFTAPTDISRKDFGLNFSLPVENGILKDEITLQIVIKAKK